MIFMYNVIVKHLLRKINKIPVRLHLNTIYQEMQYLGLNSFPAIKIHIATGFKEEKGNTFKNVFKCKPLFVFKNFLFVSSYTLKS